MFDGHDSSTIFALSSGLSPSGVGIVRLSGSQARFALEMIFGRVPPPRRMSYGSFREATGAAIDNGLAVFLPGPGTFTGEDCAELHCHGGTAVVRALLRRCGEIEGLRLAQAGEFTRRAFLNGRVNLAQAEALADLVSSETEAQRRLALEGAGEALSRLYDGWRERIIHARAMLEAELDFADEEDIPGAISNSAWSDVGRLAREIGRHLAGYHRAEMIRNGFRIVIAGPPNAGKSSLLNFLAGREAAIVSDIPGTTRDVVEIVLELGGHKVVVSDTAGLRQSDDKIETLGIAKAREQVAAAGLVLLLRDLSTDPSPVPVAGSRIVKVGTKADLAKPDAVCEGEIAISVKNGAGTDHLLEKLEEIVSETAGDDGELLPSRLRHVELLRSAQTRLGTLLEQPELPLELKAETLRLASDELGRIIGRIAPDDLLDRIFSSFCIGK